MKPLTQEQTENLQKKITEVYRGAVMEEKDVEVLADILHTEPMLKALGRLRATAEIAAFNLLGADLGDELQRHAASRLQGNVNGSIGFIDSLISLASLPEDTEDVSPATAE